MKINGKISSDEDEVEMRIKGDKISHAVFDSHGKYDFAASKRAREL